MILEDSGHAAFLTAGSIKALEATAVTGKAEDQLNCFPASETSRQDPGHVLSMKSNLLSSDLFCLLCDLLHRNSSWD